MSGFPDGVGKWDAGGLWVVAGGEGFGLDGFECADEDGGGVLDDALEVGGGALDAPVRTVVVQPAIRQLSATTANHGRRRTPNTVP